MSNASFAEEKSVNSVVEETLNDDTPRESKVKSSEDLASEFLKKHGLTKGDNGDIFIAVGTAYIKTKRPKRKSFQTKRRLLVSEASLNAKKDFCFFISIIYCPISKPIPEKRSPDESIISKRKCFLLLPTKRLPPASLH